MSRKTEMPDRKGCTSENAYQPWGFWGPKPRLHEWNYSSLWNGNHKNVVPFVMDNHGIARGGWRCFHCGKFVWDETDETFAVMLAYKLGYFGNETNRKIRSVLKGENNE